MRKKNNTKSYKTKAFKSKNYCTKAIQKRL